MSGEVCENEEKVHHVHVQQLHSRKDIYDYHKILDWIDWTPEGNRDINWKLNSEIYVMEILLEPLVWLSAFHENQYTKDSEDCWFDTLWTENRSDCQECYRNQDAVCQANSHSRTCRNKSDCCKGRRSGCYHKNDNVHSCQCKICTNTSFYKCEFDINRQIDIIASKKQIIEKDRSVLEFMDIFLSAVRDDPEFAGAKFLSQNNCTQILVKRTLDPVKSILSSIISSSKMCFVLLCKPFQNSLTVNENILFLTNGKLDKSRGVPVVIPNCIAVRYIPDVLLIACYCIVNDSQETKSGISKAHLVAVSDTSKETGLGYNGPPNSHVFLALLSIIAGSCKFLNKFKQTAELGKLCQQKQNMDFVYKVNISDISVKMATMKQGHLRHRFSEIDRDLRRSKIRFLLEEALSAKNRKVALHELLFRSNFQASGQDVFVYPVHRNGGQVSTVNPAIHRNTLNPLLERYATTSPPTRRETMSYEILRLCTLHDYPVQRTPSFLRLSQAGFYYEGRGNALNCFACDLKYQNWKFEDDPLQIHKRFSPRCPFVNGYSSGNIPVQHAEDLVARNAQPARSDEPSVASGDGILTDGARESGSTGITNDRGLETDLSPDPRVVLASSASASQPRPAEGSPSVSTPNSLLQSNSQASSSAAGSPNNNNCPTGTGSDSGIGRSSPATNQQRGAMPAATGYVANTAASHSRYSTKSARLASFSNWPTTSTQHPRDMTEAGFFYNGNGDSVRCFQCGIGLRNWDAGDSPWIEHARWSPECPYILEIKGQDFVDLVLDAAQRAEREAEELSEAAASNFNGTSRDSGYSTVGQDALTGVETAAKEAPAAAKEAPAASADNVNTQTTRSDGVKPNQRTQSHGTVTAPKYPLQTEAAQCIIKKGYLPKIVKQGIDRLVEKKGWIAFNATNILNEIRELEKDSGLGSSGSGSSGSESDSKTKIPKSKAEMSSQNQELKELLTCKICLDESVSIAFLPCGHLVACAQCSPALRKCPICRKGIKGTVRTNLLEAC